MRKKSCLFFSFNKNKIKTRVFLFLSFLKTHFQVFYICEVSNDTYEYEKRVMLRSKWKINFGEGEKLKHRLRKAHFSFDIKWNCLRGGKCKNEIEKLKKCTRKIERKTSKWKATKIKFAHTHFELIIIIFTL